MDPFPPGWSFFFVAKGEAERAIQRSPLGTVGGIEKADEPTSVGNDGTHRGLGERCHAIRGPLPPVDDGAAGRDVALDLACLASCKSGSIPARMAARMRSSSTRNRSC